MGASQAFSRWLFFDVLKELTDTCRSGSEPQRTGVAKIARLFAKDAKYADKCFPVLADMCNDPTDKIRRLVAFAFHDERLLLVPNVSKALLEFIESEVFADDPDSLCDSLYDFVGSLTQFTDVAIATVKKTIDLKRNPCERPNRRTGLLDFHLNGVILRLNEQSSSPAYAKIRDECLDSIDDMLKHRVTPTHSLLEEISK